MKRFSLECGTAYSNGWRIACFADHKKDSWVVLALNRGLGVRYRVRIKDRYIALDHIADLSNYYHTLPPTHLED